METSSRLGHAIVILLSLCTLLYGDTMYNDVNIVKELEVLDVNIYGYLTVGFTAQAGHFLSTGDANILGDLKVSDIKANPPLDILP